MPWTLTGWVANAARHCRRDRGAGVALMFALAVIPVTGLIGIAIDLGFVTELKTQLNSAADAAALAAAKGAADAFSAGQSSDNAITAGETAGRQWFSSQAGSVTDAALATDAAGNAASVTVTQSGAVFNSAVSYQGAVKLFFGPLFGVSSVPLGGASSATITTTAYVSVTFLLDNSSSMLIAATQAGVDWMNANTQAYAQTVSVPDGLGNLQCAFACHWDANGNDYYGLARRNNVQLRFDVLQTAAASAINQMISQQQISDQFSLSVYTFGGFDTSGGSSLKQVYPASADQADSTDLTDGASAVQGIQTPVGPDQADTDFPEVMNALATESTVASNGSSVTNRKKALIIVTDGMADYGSRSTPTSKGPIDPANCAAMKSLGYSVYVLYTTYITTPSNLLLPFDNINLLPYINGTATPAMATSLQSCASAPSDYAEASDPAAINATMKNMLQAALGNGGRFTN